MAYADTGAHIEAKMEPSRGGLEEAIPRNTIQSRLDNLTKRAIDIKEFLNGAAYEKLSPVLEERPIEQTAAKEPGMPEKDAGKIRYQIHVLDNILGEINFSLKHLIESVEL